MCAKRKEREREKMERTGRERRTESLNVECVQWGDRTGVREENLKCTHRSPVQRKQRCVKGKKRERRDGERRKRKNA